MPTIDEYRLWSINRVVEGVDFSMALVSDRHYTYVQGAANGAIDLAGNRFRTDGHQYTNGMIIRLGMSAGTPPVPLDADVDYYVVNAIPDYFQVALTSGGAAIDLTAAPVGGSYFWSLYRLPVSVDVGTDTFSAVNHPFVDGERIIFENTGGGLPAGILANTNYYVVNSVADVSFQVSTSLGGSPVNMTGAGSGTQLCYAPELNEADSAATWLNREVFRYGSAFRKTWTGATETNPLGTPEVVIFTPGIHPIPCRWAFIFLTDGMTNVAKWYQDLGAGNVILVSGRSFEVRDFVPN